MSLSVYIYIYIYIYFYICICILGTYVCGFCARTVFLTAWERLITDVCTHLSFVAAISLFGLRLASPRTTRNSFPETSKMLGNVSHIKDLASPSCQKLYATQLAFPP